MAVYTARNKDAETKPHAPDQTHVTGGEGVAAETDRSSLVQVSVCRWPPSAVSVREGGTGCPRRKAEEEGTIREPVH